MVWPGPNMEGKKPALYPNTDCYLSRPVGLKTGLVPHYRTPFSSPEAHRPPNPLETLGGRRRGASRRRPWRRTGTRRTRLRMAAALLPWTPLRAPPPPRKTPNVFFPLSFLSEVSVDSRSQPLCLLNKTARFMFFLLFVLQRWIRPRGAGRRRHRLRSVRSTGKQLGCIYLLGKTN
jgi:hypothetical protein